MGLFSEIFTSTQQDEFGFGIGGIGGKIHKMYKSGDSSYISSILDSIGIQLFITYFEIPEELGGKESKTAVGKPILFIDGEKKYFPIFTGINMLIKWQAIPGEGMKLKTTNLYINYLEELLNTEEYGDVDGFIINPYSKEPLIIKKETYFGREDKVTDNGVIV